MSFTQKWEEIEFLRKEVEEEWLTSNLIGRIHNNCNTKIVRERLVMGE